MRFLLGVGIVEKSRAFDKMVAHVLVIVQFLVNVMKLLSEGNIF